MLNKFICVRDVTFNKNNFFSSNLNNFKDNLLNVIKKEIEEVICSYEISDKAVLTNLLNQGYNCKKKTKIKRSFVTLSPSALF